MPEPVGTSASAALLPRARREVVGPALLCAALGLLTLALAWRGFDSRLPVAANFAALFHAPLGAPAMALMHFSWWPRLTVALLAGSGLSLAGVLMQQVLKNPLASPTTLGVASGAQLALTAATLYTPGLLLVGREWVALAGGGLAMGLVFALAWRQKLSPVVVIVAGMVINLYFSALAMVLVLLHPETLSGVLIWSAGALTQSNWDVAAFLWPRLLGATLLALLLIRPLTIMALDDASVKSLGLSLKHLRMAALGLAVFVTACVVSVVGVIGFIGLAAPAIARLAGARQLRARLLWSPLLGALLLVVTDLVLQQLRAMVPMLLPTGAMTAALGAPLLLWLIPRLQSGGVEPGTHVSISHRRAAPGRLLAGLAIALPVVAAFALLVGQSADGWASALSWAQAMAAVEWRLPRVLAAGAAGVMLALAGAILQRTTGNPMASPEVLGISAGASIGLIAVLFFLPGADGWVLISLGAVGALVTMAGLVLINRGSGFAPERVLLSGIAIAALFNALRSFVLASGDPRGNQLIAWIYGSTYYVDLPTALVATLAAAVFALACWPAMRWLDVLPLGVTVSRAIGVPVTASRLTLLALTAVLVACSTLLIGPLSFIGLLAPHMAQLLGFERARTHLMGAALVGALLMISADWVGRQLLFPEDIPAGLVASVLGGAYFMWGLRRL